MTAPAQMQLAAAVALAAEGFRIFPVQAGRKSPPVKGWQQWATADPEKIRAHWSVAPRDNIGIACGDGVLVLDVDGETGARSLAALEASHGKLPETCKVSTPSGGSHYYFNGPDVSNTVGALGAGLDMRSRGGYCIAPGSRTEKGAYTVAHGAEPAQAPRWLIDLCSKPREKANKGEAVPDAPASAVERAREWLAKQPPAIEGQGGDAYTFKTACGLRDLGVSEAQTAELMAGEWNARCSPPWDVADLRAKAANAFRYAENEPGSRTAQPEDFPIVQASTPEAPQPKPRAKGGTLHDMAKRINSGAYLVKGLLRRKSHAVMYGAPGEGKSFLALDLAYTVAAGREWHARRVSQGPALYLAFEGLGGMPERAAALLQHYGKTAVPLVIEPADWNLRDKVGREALGARMAEIRAEHFGGHQPALIVLDTLARSMRGGDENSAQDMGALNDAVTALIESTGACVLLVHHSGKNRAAGARGSSALLGAVDTELEIEGGQLKATKQRDVELGALIGFKLEPVLVGEDADGEPMLSCVVLASAGGARPTWKPSGKAADAWKVLCELGGDSNAAVDRGELGRAFRARAYPTGEAPESTSRSALDRALGSFLERGMIEGPEGGPWRRRLTGGELSGAPGGS